MYVGRRKNNAFKFLNDRISQKLQNWSNKSMSKGGKEVLKKTTTQSVPNFWMILFLIPGEVCNGIQKLMNVLWRGNNDKSKGISWMS